MRHRMDTFTNDSSSLAKLPLCLSTIAREMTLRWQIDIDDMACMPAIYLNALHTSYPSTATPRHKATQGLQYVSAIQLSPLMPSTPHSAAWRRRHDFHLHPSGCAPVTCTLPPRRLASPALPPTSLHHDVLSLCRGRIASAVSLIQHGPVRILTWDADVSPDSAREGVIGLPIPFGITHSSFDRQGGRIQ
jgi:hypothetical protein